MLCVNQITDCVARGEHGRPLDAGAAAAAAAAGRPTKNTGHTGGLRLVSLGREVVPALGLAWANCVNARLFLSRCSVGDSATPALYRGPPCAAAAAAASALGSGGAGPPPLRRIQVVFAPHLPQRECFYVVERTGVRGLRPEELESHEEQQAAALTAAAIEQAAAQREWEAMGRQQQQQSSGPHLGRPNQQGWQWQHAAGSGPPLALQVGQSQQWKQQRSGAELLPGAHQQQLRQQPTTQGQLRSLFIPQHLQGFSRPPQQQQQPGGQQWQQGTLQERPTNWQPQQSWQPSSSGQQCHPDQQPSQQQMTQ